MKQEKQKQRNRETGENMKLGSQRVGEIETGETETETKKQEKI